MNNEYVSNMARNLEERYGWNYPCAHAFAEFISEANENNVNCLPKNYRDWCKFVIEASKLPREHRPQVEHIIDYLVNVMGWKYSEGDEFGYSANYLKVEYLKGLSLLDFFTNQQEMFVK